MRPLSCPCPGERGQEDPDLLTSHSCQVPPNLPSTSLLPSNWSFPGDFGERVSLFEGNILAPHIVSQGAEPIVGTPSPVFFL